MAQTYYIKNNILCGEEKPILSHSHGIGQVFLNCFTDKPNHIGQIDIKTNTETTFAEMKENTIRCALWMQKEKIGENDVVAICTPNIGDAYIPCIATFYVGAIYNTWEPNIYLPSARHYMKLVKPKVIFVYESDVEIIKEAAALENVEVKIIVFGKYPKLQSLKDVLGLQVRTEVQNFQCFSTENPKSIAMILFSSGTTGLSKGVAYSYELLSRITANSNIFSGNQRKSLWYTSLCWISGTFLLLQNILAARTIILHTKFEPEEACKVIEEFQVDWLFLTPSLLIYLCKSNVLKTFKLKSLKTLISGGSKISRELICYIKENLSHVQFVQGYGMTELGGAVCVSNEHCKRIESVGFIMPNTQLKIIDVDSGKLLGPNQPGELYVKLSTLMTCYYQNPSATEEIIDEEGWLRTGDKGYYDENGEVVIIDRLKELITYGGYHIIPSEIEELLTNHADVIEAAVVPVPHDVDIERAMAFVKKHPNSKVSEQDLIELSSKLGKEKTLWGGVQFMDEIPHTASGKINRKKLKEIAKLNVNSNVNM